MAFCLLNPLSHAHDTLPGRAMDLLGHGKHAEDPSTCLKVFFSHGEHVCGPLAVYPAMHVQFSMFTLPGGKIEFIGHLTRGDGVVGTGVVVDQLLLDAEAEALEKGAGVLEDKCQKIEQNESKSAHASPQTEANLVVGAEDVDELVVAAVEGAGVLLVVGSGVVLEVVGAAVEEEVGVIAVLGVVLEASVREISKQARK